MSIEPVVVGENEAKSPAARPSMPSSWRHALPLPSSHTPLVHAVANGLPQSATLPDGHFLQVALSIVFDSCVAIVLPIVVTNEPIRKFRPSHTIPPLSETSALVRFDTATFDAAMRVVPVVASCVNP